MPTKQAGGVGVGDPRDSEKIKDCKVTIPGATLADSTGSRRIRKLQERCQHINGQIAELKEKRRLMRCEAWQIRSEGTCNPTVRMFCRIIRQCYR
jgi:hypothetical protein